MTQNSMRRSIDPQSSVLPFIFSRIVPAIAIIIFFWLGVIIFSDHQTIQTFDPRFSFYNPWDRAAIPLAHHFEAPMGSENWAYTYNAQPFDELNKSRGGKHSGDDINGIGGQNSDLGDPVFAAADGIVVYIGNPSPGWGNCIILAHRTEDGTLIQSMYAHLLTTSVYRHQTVSRGSIIGSVGQADVGYLAHLHLEIRESDGVSPFLSGYPKLNQHDRINPTEFINSKRIDKEQQLAPSTLSTLQKNRKLPQLGLKLTAPYDQETFMRYQRYIIEANKGEKAQDIEK